MTFTLAFDNQTLECTAVRSEHGSLVLVDTVGGTWSVPFEPVVIDGAENLEAHLRALCRWNPSRFASIETYYIALKKALLMHEIATLQRRDPRLFNNPDILPAIYYVPAMNNDDKIHVGWNFQPTAAAVAGNRVHYDHGAGIAKNSDALILAAKPMHNDELFLFSRMRKHQMSEPASMILLLADGSFKAGSWQWDPSSDTVFSNNPLFGNHAFKQAEIALASFFSPQSIHAWISPLEQNANGGAGQFQHVIEQSIERIARMLMLRQYHTLLSHITAS